MKIRTRIILTYILIAGIVAGQACSFFHKSDFLVLSATDLSSFVEGRLPEPQKRRLAQSENERKQIIQTFKRAFALAQAGEAAGLHKTEKFKRQFDLSVDQILSSEYSKRNPDVTVTKEEADAYYNAHKDGFEADFMLISEGQKPPPSDEIKDSFKPRWGELKLRAAKGRQAGIEKEPGFTVQLKFSKANLLANLYTDSLSDRFKLSQEEKNKYVAEHPEADLEKLKQKAQGLLDRVKKGESFEKIADEANDDGTKGRGGDLDWFGKGRMDPDFEKAAFSLDKGQVSSELVKTGFGYHIIRVDDKRTATPPAPPAQTPPEAPNAAPSPKPQGPPQEEIHARHIYVSTKEAEGYEQKLIDEKVKRAMEDAEIKYKVNVPTDFQIKVAGLDPNRIPKMGGGPGGVNPHGNP